MRAGDKQRKLPRSSALRISLLILACLIWSQPAWSKSARPKAPPPVSAEILKQGEVMYRQGILASGEPVQAIVQGDIPVEGTMFTCESCHMRSGVGVIEGGVITPATTAAALFVPLHDGAFSSSTQREKLPSYFKPRFRRPAYTDKTLAVLLRDGMDPTGRVIADVMPRYQLKDGDMAVLIAYLKSLSAAFSPGVTPTTLRFATIITEEVSPEDRAAMLGILEEFIRLRNSRAEVREGRAKYFMAEEMDLSFRRLELVRWELKGPPESWRRQLETYYRQAPVFAILGGITTGEWKPIHEFSEENRIPCLFPITDFPVVSATDWYTVYFSKGLYQEGDATARYLASTVAIAPEETVLQIYRDDRQGRDLADGFAAAWQELGRRQAVSIPLKSGQAPTRELLQQVVERERPTVILLWAGAEAIPVLEPLTATANGPRLVFVSGGLLGESLWQLPEGVRTRTFITYPYRLPQEEDGYARQIQAWMAYQKLPLTNERIAARMNILARILTDTLMHLKRNYYRDYFLDVVSMLSDREYALYERISFGPGQRYASKGCYIVQLEAGDKPLLAKRSEWVTH
jgi:hypothetical protein